MTAPVSWRGLTAPYDRSERQIMKTLTVKEQAYIHRLKALTDGEVEDGPQEPEALTDGECRVKSLPGSRPGGDGAASGHGLNDGSDSAAAPAAYIDPEDIPFGGEGRSVPKTVRKRPIYALSWTWKSSRIYKTKAKAEVKRRAWKRWYERNGWKVTSHPTGYFAAKDGLRHSISLHEYDRETRERVK